MISESEYRYHITMPDGLAVLIDMYQERKERLMEKEWNRAQIAYEAYAEHTDWKSLATGDNLPTWSDLPLTIRAAWFYAAEAAYKYDKA